MLAQPRIKLDASRLLGFKQIKRALPGRLAGPQAEVGPVAPTPEPSTWMEFLVGLLVLGVFALRSHYQKKKEARAAAIAASQPQAGATGALTRKE